MFDSLVHTEPPSLLLVEAGLQDLRSSSTEHEKIVLSSDKYKCSPHSVICGYPNALGELLAEDHWRESRSSVSTSCNESPTRLDIPPATTKWLGVVTAAALTRFVDIGGRSSSHFVPDVLSDREDY